MAEMDTGTSFAGGSTEHASRSERLVSEGKERATQVTDTARRKAFTRADARKGELVETLDRLARNLDEFGESLSGPEGRAAAFVAGSVRKAGGFLERSSTEELANTAVRELRDRPGALIGGALVLGFLGSRLLKS